MTFTRREEIPVSARNVQPGDTLVLPWGTEKVSRVRHRRARVVIRLAGGSKLRVYPGATLTLTVSVQNDIES